MAQFKFKLGQVLQLRQRQRDQAVAAYRQAMEAVRVLETRISDLESELEMLSTEARARQTGVIDPLQLLELERYQLHLEQQRAIGQQQLAVAKMEAIKRRQTLVQCEQQVKSLERLRDRQHQQWIEAEQKRLQNTLDEWAGFRYWEKRHADTPRDR